MKTNASICALLIAAVMAATAAPAAASSANAGRQGPSLIQLIASRVMSAAGAAKGAIAEAEMREARAKAVMAARAKAAMSLQNGALMAGHAPCPNTQSNFGAAPAGDELPSLVDDTCQ